MNNNIILITFAIILALSATVLVYYRLLKWKLGEALRKAEEDYLVPKEREEVIKLDLEKTKSGRELLSRMPESLIPEQELEKAVELSEGEDHNIVFWGPTASGKSTLLAAFMANTYKNLRSIDVQYEFMENLTVLDPFDVGLLTRIRPTERSQVTRISVTRRLRRKNFSTRISSFSHFISVLDSPGEKTIQALEDDKDSNDASFIRKITLNSNNIICTLNKGNLDSEGFHQILEKLRMLLSDRPRHIVFCITKADVFGDNLIELAPEMLLIKHFGAKIGEKIYDLMGQNGFVGDGHKVFLCATSALGYRKSESSSYVPNFNPQTGGIADVDSWKPVNVDQPFFWLFTKIEEEYIMKQYSRFIGGDYIAKYALKKYIPHSFD